MQQAIIYTRYSTLEQRDGVSLERQIERCQELASEIGVEVVRVVSDSGRSGFHGRHRMNGAALAELEKEIVAGAHAGKVLLIEKISRLSREDPNDSYDLMRSMTKHGVTLACWDGRLTYQAGKNPDFLGVIQYFLTAKMVHEESAAKADFGRHRWEKRREAIARGEIVTAMCPAWLRPAPDRKSWIVVGEGEGPKLDRGEIIRTIFDLAKDGLGAETIAKKLNREGVPVWPRFSGAERKEPKVWSRTFVGRIMSNVAVIGDYQAYMMDDGQRKVPAGPPVRGYYPRIVSPDVFEEVQSGRQARKGVRGRRSAVVANLVSGLCICEVCGNPMEYARGRKQGAVVKRDGRDDETVAADTGSLRCRIAAQRLPESDPNHCDNRRNVAYLSLERALLDSCLHIALDDSAFAQTDLLARLAVEIADLRRDQEIAFKRAEALWFAVASPGDGAQPSQMAIKLAQTAELEAEAVGIRIEALEADRARAGGQVSAVEQMSRLADFRERLYATDLDDRAEARNKVAVALRSIIEKIVCTESGSSWVYFRHGLRVIQIEPGRGRRPPTFTAYDVGKKSDLEKIGGGERRLAERVWMRMRQSDGA